MRTASPALLLSALAALSAPARAAAFGVEGHAVVAAVAEARLSPGARALVREVAGSTALHDEDLASWADRQRHRDRETAPWHYVNVPFGARYDARRDCPRGACAIEALARAQDALARSRDRRERLEALRWVVHLVADLHQPLHAGDGFDRGGNLLRVRLGGRREPTNLHKVLDHDVVRAVVGGRDAARVGRALAARLDPADASAWAAELDPAAWAAESSLEAQAIYAELGVTPRDREIVALPRDWPERQRARTEAALVRAGVRLAAVLDAAARARR